MLFKDLTTSQQAHVRTIEAILENEAPEKAKEIAKQSSAYKQLHKDKTVCGAITGKANNMKVCILDSHIKEDGTTNGKCYRHGGKSTGAKTPEGKANSIANLRARTPIHGLYSEDFLSTLTQEELDIMEALEKSIKDIYEVNGLLDEAMLQALILDTIKFFRISQARMQYETVSTVDFLNRIIKVVNTLGFSKKEQAKLNNSNDLASGIASLFMEDEK